MKKLCILRPNLTVGGADRVTLTLLRELPRYNIEPQLLLVRREGELVDQAPPSTQELGAGSLWTTTGPLIDALKRIKPDVLMSTSSGANVPATLAWQALGKPFRLVLSERNVLFHGGYRLKRVMIVAAKRVLYPSADCITVISTGIADDLVDQLRVDRERIKVVYNPVVTASVHEGAKAPLQHRYFNAADGGVADGVPVILSVGRFVKEKGLDILMRAFAKVRAERRARLLILGEGPLRGEIERLARELGVADDVDMPGFDSNPFKYMARCSVFALASRHEGLPGALIQAMACGAPSICTDCPSGPSEIIERSGEEGILIPVEDVDALASSISRILGDAAFARRLSEGGKRAAAERFAVDASLPRYVEAIWPGATREARA